METGVELEVEVRTEDEQREALHRWFNAEAVSQHPTAGFYEERDSAVLLDEIPLGEYQMRLCQIMQMSRGLMAVDSYAVADGVQQGWHAIPEESRQVRVFGDISQATDFILDHSDDIISYQMVPADDDDPDGYFYTWFEIHLGG